MKKNLWRMMIMLTLMLAATFLPAARAETTTGMSGEVSWRFDSETGILTISGEGAMEDYSRAGTYSDGYYYTNPWNGADDIVEIVVEEGVTAIGNNAFRYREESYRSALTRVSLPSTLTRIGNAAFYKCNNLTELTLPASLESIGSSAFYDCAHLTNVTLPASLASVGSYAFYGCQGFTEIVIPDGWEIITASAFNDCSGVETITIPASVKTIENNAFLNCFGVTKVVYGGASAEDWAQIDFQNIGSNPMFVGNNNTSGVGYGIDKEPKACLYVGGELVDSLHLTADVGNVSRFAFVKCPNAMTVTVDADYAGSIGISAFERAIGLTNITFLGKGVSIGTNAMKGVTATVSYRPGDSWTGKAQGYGGSLTWVPVGGACGDDARWTLTDEGKLKISGYGDVAGGDWGAYIDEITGVTLADGAQITGYADGVFDGIDGVYAGRCGESVGWLLSDGDLIVTGVGDMNDYSDNTMPWFDKKPLQTIEVRDGVTSVGNSAFSGVAYNLFVSSVTLADSVSRIGNQAFYSCGGLTSLTLPQNLQTIGYSAFSNTLITELTLPAGVANLGYLYDRGPFNYMTRLRTIDVAEDNAAYASVDGVLLTKDGKTLVKYPAGRSEKLCAVPEGVETIATNALSNYGYPDATGTMVDHSFILPASVARVDDYAMEGSSSSIRALYFLGAQPEFAANALQNVSKAYIADNASADGLWPKRPSGTTWSTFCGVKDGEAVLSHDYQFVAAREATCAEDGVERHEVCALCGHLKASNGATMSASHAGDFVLPALGHDYQPGFAWAEDGQTCKVEFTCARCEDAFDVDAVVTSEVTLEPDCTTVGQTTYTATVEYEGETYSNTLTLNDIPVRHVEIVTPGEAPTCTEPGLSDEIVCEICGELLQEMTEIPPLGHGFGAPDFIWDESGAACDAVFTCARCGETETRACDVTGEETLAPSCTAMGETTYTAWVSMNGVEYTDTFTIADIPMNPHDIAPIPAVEPTCTEDGATEGTYCPVCGTVTVEPEIIPAHHTYGAPAFHWTDDGAACEAVFTCINGDDEQTVACTVTSETAVEPTCSAMGVTRYAATAAFEGQTYTETTERADISMIAHTPVDDEAVAPTDRETGLTAGSHCAVCGEILVAQEVTPALWSYDEAGTTATAYNGDAVDVTIPDGVTALSATLFKNNAAIQTVRVPDAVASVGTQTFYGCTALTDIYLPDDLSGIAATTFYSVTARIHAAAGSMTATALSLRRLNFVDGDWTLTHTVKSLSAGATGTTIVRWAGGAAALVIPDDFGGAPTTAIGAGAFADASLTDVTIPVSVTSIAADAFAGCPDGLVIRSEYDAEARAFALENGYAWQHLAHTEETIPGTPATCTTTGFTDGVRCAVCGEILAEQNEIPKTAHTEEIIPGTPATCTAVGLTDGVKCAVCGEILVEQTEIPMTAHTEETIPSVAPTETEPGHAGGERCAVCGEILAEPTTIPALQDMSTLSLPAGLKTVDDEAFAGTAAEAVLIPEGATAIGARAFANSPNLTYVRVPASVTTIAPDAFEGCDRLLLIDRAE